MKGRQYCLVKCDIKKNALAKLGVFNGIPNNSASSIPHHHYRVAG
jgi:hypothetical protein